MKLKKMVALFMTAAMTMSMLAGCGQEQAETTTDTKEDSSVSETQKDAASEDEGEAEDAGEAADVAGTGVTFPLDEPYEIDVVVCGGNDVVYEFTDTLIYQYMEEKTNVKMNVTTLGYSELEEKINLMMSSGDYPDVFLKAGTGPEKYISQGILLPLEDYMKEYAPTYASLIEADPGGWAAVSSGDGHVYSFYSVGSPNNVTFGGIPYMYINTQWLENLGLEMPHDPDSFYEVMKAFKDEDADGDGDPANEVPLIFAGGNIIPVDDLLPHFGFNMDGFYSGWALSEDESAVEYYAITDRYKEALAYMTKLYEEGIMHKDSLTQTHDQVEAMGQTGTAIGCFVAWDPQYTVGAYDPSLPYEENLVTQYKAMTPWDGGKATSGTNLGSGGLYITDKCEKPEVVVAWTDLLYSEETTMLSNYGEEGVTFNWVEDGKVEMINIDGLVQSDTNPYLMTLGGATAAPYKQYVDGVETYFDTETNPYARYVNEVTAEWIAAGKKFDPWPAYKLTTEESQENADILADADPYREQYRAEVITGVKDLDETWDEFVATMIEMRIETAIENVNAAYQRYLSLK